LRVKNGKGRDPKIPARCCPAKAARLLTILSILSKCAAVKEVMMRNRKEIEKDFNNSMPSRKDELLVFQREKLKIEVALNILELLDRVSISLKAILAR